jgi:hypothetical protein
MLLDVKYQSDFGYFERYRPTPTFSLQKYKYQKFTNCSQKKGEIKNEKTN